jgi:hypothetical protein
MQDSINERLGDAELYHDSTKLFKPLSEKIESSSKVLEPIVTSVKARNQNSYHFSLIYNNRSNTRSGRFNT